jgi:hypothetical protein
LAIRLTDIPCPCSSATLRRVASGIGGRLVRFPCAFPRHAGLDPLADERALELGEVGHRPEHHLACGVVVSTFSW